MDFNANGCLEAPSIYFLFLASPHRKPNKKRPSTLPVTVSSSAASAGGGEIKNKSSSDEEEFSFFTDTVQVNKTDCLWLGKARLVSLIIPLDR